MMVFRQNMENGKKYRKANLLQERIGKSYLKKKMIIGREKHIDLQNILSL
jgi:hypothetical protein